METGSFLDIFKHGDGGKMGASGSLQKKTWARQGFTAPPAAWMNLMCRMYTPRAPQRSTGTQNSEKICTVLCRVRHDSQNALPNTITEMRADTIT